jgi:hypothetical protein
MKRRNLSPLWLTITLVFSTCAGGQKEPVQSAPEKQVSRPVPTGPSRIVLAEKPVLLQDEQEPHRTRVEFPFELPSRPRRARLVLKASGVPGATSKDYTMGRFRHKVLLNDRFLMDLNTFSKGEDQLLEHTKWISVGMLRARNKLTFEAGDDQKREGTPDHDEYELKSVILEFDW